MAIFRNIQMSFWTDTKILDDFTPEDKYFYLYLMTNPHTTLSGCYEVSLKDISNETGYSKDTVESLLTRFSEVHNVIRYSKETKEVYLINWPKYNWTSSDMLDKPLSEQIAKIKNQYFREELKELYNIREIRKEEERQRKEQKTNSKKKSEQKDRIPYGIGYGIPYGIDTPCIDTTDTDTDTVYINNNNLDLSIIFNKMMEMYPKKSSMNAAQLIFVQIIKDVIPENREAVANNFVSALEMFMNDYFKTHTKDEIKFMPKLDDWLKNDSMYWMKKIESEKPEDFEWSD